MHPPETTRRPKAGGWISQVLKYAAHRPMMCFGQQQLSSSAGYHSTFAVAGTGKNLCAPAAQCQEN